MLEKCKTGLGSLPSLFRETATDYGRTCVAGTFWQTGRANTGGRPTATESKRDKMRKAAVEKKLEANTEK